MERMDQTPKIPDLLDSYRLVSGAVVDLREAPFEVRAYIADLGLRLLQRQGYVELIGRVMMPSSPIYGGASPLAPGASELPAVRVAHDIVYRVGVAEGAIQPSEGADEGVLPSVLRRADAGPAVVSGPPSGQLTTEKIVTVGEAMNLLGITRQAVINSVHAGKVRGEQHGRLWLLSREDVLRYREARGNRTAARRR